MMKIYLILWLTGAGFFISAAPLTLFRNPFTYADQYTDPESHLQYLQARYYSPVVLRFVERDSYDLLNRYAYADGNPMMNADPSGHSSETQLLGFSSVMLGGYMTMAGAMRMGEASLNDANFLYTFRREPATMFGSTLSMAFDFSAFVTGVVAMTNDSHQLAVNAMVVASFGAVMMESSRTFRPCIEARNEYGFNFMRLHENGTDYDDNGFDYFGKRRDGSLYNGRGFNRDGMHRNGSVYDDDGFNFAGGHRNGTLYNSDGFNYRHVHRNRTFYNNDGFNYRHVHRNGTLYDENDFNYQGIHRNGTLYNQYGFNRAGYNERGFNQLGIHMIRGELASIRLPNNPSSAFIPNDVINIMYDYFIDFNADIDDVKVDE